MRLGKPADLFLPTKIVTVLTFLYTGRKKSLFLCTFALKTNQLRDMIFRRKLYDDMLKWKENFSGSMALLIKGARRVGKSTLAETFAKNEYE